MTAAEMHEKLTFAVKTARRRAKRILRELEEARAEAGQIAQQEQDSRAYDRYMQEWLELHLISLASDLNAV